MHLETQPILVILLQQICNGWAGPTDQDEFAEEVARLRVEALIRAKIDEKEFKVFN